MKLNEMREKTVDELQSAIVDWKKDLFNYKLQLSTHKLENTALISKTKKLIAQAKTVINEKQAQRELAVKTAIVGTFKVSGKFAFPINQGEQTKCLKRKNKAQ